MTRRDWGMVSLDNGQPLVFGPPIDPIRPVGRAATTLCKAAERGDTHLHTARALPDGATIRVGDEIAIVAEQWWGQTSGQFCKLAAPLTVAHPIATVVVVLAGKGECAHLSAVPVDISTGETVAFLCAECDTQLPADWTS